MQPLPDRRTTEALAQADSNQHGGLRVLHGTIAPSQVPTEDEWFAGKLGRPNVKKLFVGTPDGTFLIRESDRPPGGEYSLSVKYNNAIRHIKINRKGNMYDLAPDAKAFASIQEMVDHFQTHSLNRHFPDIKTTLSIPIKGAKKKGMLQRLRGQYSELYGSELIIGDGELLSVSVCLCLTVCAVLISQSFMCG